MKKIAVLVVSILFYASVVPIVAETPEITEARIAAENDVEGFKWKWFFAGCFTTYSSPILVLSATAFNAYFLDGSVDVTDNSACWLAAYGAYVLAPTAVAIIHSPTPPADRLLGKSSEWVNAYTKAYKNTMRRYRTGASLTGCLAGGVMLYATIAYFAVTPAD